MLFLTQIVKARLNIKPFLKLAKKQKLSVKHCEITKGHKLFHVSMAKYANLYPNYMSEIKLFVDKAVQNRFDDGITKIVIKEDSKTTGQASKSQSVLVEETSC